MRNAFVDNNVRLLHTCKCKINGGWLSIKDKTYTIKCNNCGRKYKIMPNGIIKESLPSRILGFVLRR